MVLTNAEQIRELTAAQASRPFRIHLQGVKVSEAGPSENSAMILADATASVYVIGPTNIFSKVRRGDRLEVEGVTSAGQFAPIALGRKVRIIGRAPVPQPLPVTYGQMIAGNMDGQFVEVSGVVRHWEPITASNEFGKWHMELALDGGRLMISSDDKHQAGVEQDAEVRVQGVCLYQFNDKRQVLSPTLLIPKGVAIEIEKPAPENPFAAPVRPVASLFLFSPQADYRHRVHVHGVVTYQEPGVAVWIRDRSSGLRVETRQRVAVGLGENIDVVGYPRYGYVTPVLEDALFQNQSQGPAPIPVILTNTARAFDHEEDVVSLDAWLTGIDPVDEGWSFTLEKDGVTFKALLRQAAGEHGAIPWLRGSRVRITGICSVISDESRPVISGIWHPRSFQILVRSPVDVAVITLPPWWTPRRVVYICALIAAVSLLAIAVVMFIARLHLREQARRRAMAEAEFSAILTERNRLAREIHDTLAQGLTATSVQLMLARKNLNGVTGALPHHLDAAHQLVRESLEEARNSIWNMRSHVLESNDLAGALQIVLKHFCEGTEVQAHLEQTGPTRRFAPVVENNLLRLAQESIANALKHARATQIIVKLEFGERQFRLIVRDNGTGFNPATAAAGDGKFGLVGMRERAAELKGDLKVESDPARGTEVILTLQLTANQARE
jgi:signal transduction histidine kinase